MCIFIDDLSCYFTDIPMEQSNYGIPTSVSCKKTIIYIKNHMYTYYYD